MWLSTAELEVGGRGCEAASPVGLRPDLGIECRLVRGREGEPVEHGNESRCLKMILMMNPVVVVVVGARNKL